MVVPEGEEEPEYLTTFVLEKDGVKERIHLRKIIPRIRPGTFVDSLDGVGERRICAPRT